jgi:hypothetical protein
MSTDEKPQVTEEPQKNSFEEPQEGICEEQQRRGQYVVNADNPEPPGRGQYVAGANNTESPEGIESIEDKSKTA